MKEFITRCTCDACGKECKERYVLSVGVGNWDDDEDVTDKISRDLCYTCYTQLLDLIDARKVETVKVKARDKRVVPLTTEENEGFADDFEMGMSDKDLGMKYRLSINQTRYRCARLRRLGYVRGILKQMGDPENEKPQMITKVDESGLVLSIGRAE